VVKIWYLHLACHSCSVRFSCFDSCWPLLCSHHEDIAHTRRITCVAGSRRPHSNKLLSMVTGACRILLSRRQPHTTRQSPRVDPTTTDMRPVECSHAGGTNPVTKPGAWLDLKGGHHRTGGPGSLPICQPSPPPPPPPIDCCLTELHLRRCISRLHSSPHRRRRLPL
jgi:hypothetical protein